jgi:hypothetical protein
LRRFAEDFVAAAAGLAVLLTGVAEGQTCFTLQAEMMHLQSRGSGNSFNDQARYERAYREQANVLMRTEMRARQANCFGGRFFLFRRGPDPSCDMLIPRLRDMQENLARLDHMRRRGGDGSDRIRELQGMMNAYGCDLPGGESENPPGGNFIFEPNEPSYMGNGTYRTLCVRTCDGYYFPISFSTTSDHFAEDQHACETMCPGAEARLFYYENPGGSPENMTSIAGEPYSSLPTAFKYRTSIDSACTCRPAGGYTVTATAQSEGQTIAEDPTAPVPRPRPGFGEDPETLADRAGYYLPRAPVIAAATAGPVGTSADGHPVRIVGPAYWGKNKEQDDLIIAPVPN